jgi:hypothetical protein
LPALYIIEAHGLLPKNKDFKEHGRAEQFKTKTIPKFPPIPSIVKHRNGCMHEGAASVFCAGYVAQEAEASSDKPAGVLAMF